MKDSETKLLNVIEWCVTVAAAVCIFTNILSVNVGYSNLEKKYERTYAYCLRLADRIEQTEGYYQGIPIYMIGVVGEDNFPVTDITENVTDHMLGIDGNWLIYTPANYEAFYKHYMGITFNFLRPDEANYYDSAESFSTDAYGVLQTLGDLPVDYINIVSGQYRCDEVSPDDYGSAAALAEAVGKVF